MRKNIDIELTAGYLTIRIDLGEQATPSKEGRLILATTGRMIRLEHGLQLSLLCLKDEKC